MQHACMGDAECVVMWVYYTQVPRTVAGRDLHVSLREARLQISIPGGAGGASASATQVEGTLRNPAKGFGNGSVWELVSEGDGKVCLIWQHLHC